MVLRNIGDPAKGNPAGKQAHKATGPYRRPGCQGKKGWWWLGVNQELFVAAKGFFVLLGWEGAYNQAAYV